MVRGKIYMRTLLLSLKPQVFEKILSGEKIYEHRKVFPNEPVKAYLYVSRPIQSLVGILYLDNKINIEEWKEKYKSDQAAQARIDVYLKHHKVAMEIKKFQYTNAIPLAKVRETFPNFIIPQMYYYLEGLPLLDYLQENLHPIGAPICHNFENVTSEMICIN